MQNKQCNSLLLNKQQYARPVVEILKFKNADIVRTSNGGVGTMNWGEDWKGVWEPDRDFTK